MIGLGNNAVKLIDHCSDWQDLYAREESQLQNKLGKIAKKLNILVVHQFQQ